MLLLAGCSSLPPQTPWVGSTEVTRQLEQKRFNQALDQLVATQSLSGLRDFRQQNPGGDWGARAETIILYIEELTQRKDQLEQLSGEQLLLQAENQQLIEKIEQLKRLLIQLEQRPQ